MMNSKEEKGNEGIRSVVLQSLRIAFEYLSNVLEFLFLPSTRFHKARNSTRTTINADPLCSKTAGPRVNVNPSDGRDFSHISCSPGQRIKCPIDASINLPLVFRLCARALQSLPYRGGRSGHSFCCVTAMKEKLVLSPQAPSITFCYFSRTWALSKGSV